MKKKLAVVIVFIIILVFPMVSWPIVSHFDVRLDENREKAEFPTFGDDVFAQFDDYFADRAPYRDMLIKLYKRVERSLGLLYAKMLPDTADYFTEINKVLIGQEDWLFYTDDDSLDYYKGTNLPTERELRSYVARAEKVNDYFKAQGKEFAIFIAPNKEHIYSEYIPDGVHVINQMKRLDVIYDYFKEHSDVKVIYPKEELIEAKSIRDTYLMQDTHWNDFGAYIGAKALLESMRYAIGDVDVSEIQWSGGDLAKMAVINPSKYTAYKVSYRPEVTIKYRVTDVDRYEIESSNKNGKNLFVLGDSFMIADYSSRGNYRAGMKEMIAKEYENFVVTHWNTFTVESAYSSEFDVATTVIFQAVERNERSMFEQWGFLQRFIDIYGL